MDLPKTTPIAEELNEANPRQTRGHGSSTTSPVWKYFKLNDDNPIQATCLVCGILMSRGGISPSRCGTTNLRRHLSFAHGIALPSKKKPQQAVRSLKQQAQTHKHLLAQKPKQKKPLVSTSVPNPPPPFEICLRWTSYHSNMQTVFPSLLNNEHFVDVTLACEGRSIKCHRVILSACSSYFEDILCHTPCQHPIIIIKDLRFEELRTLVDFMYKGEVYVTQERLPTLLAAADALQIKGLSGSSATGPSNNEDIFATTPLKDESKNCKTSDKQKSPSAVRGKYQHSQTSPGTSRSLSGVKSTGKSRPNGIQHSTTTKSSTRPTSLSQFLPKHRLKTPLNQIKFKSESHDSDKGNDSLFPVHPLQYMFQSELQEGDISNNSLDPDTRLKTMLQSEPQDIIISNDSICPAPICELSDDKSINTNEDDDKSWSKEHGMASEMVPMDDDSETGDMDGSSQRFLMVPEVIMDCSENSNSSED